LRSVGKSEALRAVIPTTISTTWISVLFAHRVLSLVRVDRFNQKVIIIYQIVPEAILAPLILLTPFCFVMESPKNIQLLHKGKKSINN